MLDHLRIIKAFIKAVIRAVIRAVAGCDARNSPDQLPASKVG
jgi:hypothetical protein